MSAWLTAHFQAMARAIARMRAQPLATLLSVAVIAIAILLPLGLYLCFENVRSAVSQMNTEPNVNVYLSLNATDTDVKDVERQLRAHTNAAVVLFISREVALAEMRKRTTLGDLLAGIEANPLPHAFAIKPKSWDTEALAAMRRDLLRIPKVETANVEFEWAVKLTRFARFAERLIALLGVLLAAAVVFVVGNTIRLQMMTQKDEIIVARLIGATRRFVRRPFLYFGAIQGAAAGGIAVVAVVGLAAWVGGEVAQLAASYGTSFTIRSLGPVLSGLVVVLSAALGWLGAFFSVAIYWKQIGTER
jgi:cell division transport system permease protein